MGSPLKNITGMRYGRLTVVEYVGKQKNGQSLWLCKCSCGKTVVKRKSALTCGVTKSCGCYRKERAAGLNKTHGLSSTKPYSVWKNMVDRCRNPENKDFHHYGGRGIAVCKEWLTLEGFMGDMGASFKDGLTLERVDNSKGYCEDNCRWATRKEQSNNLRSNRMVTYNGETLTMSQTAEKYNVNYYLLRSRMQQDWPAGKAIILPAAARNR